MAQKKCRYCMAMLSPGVKICPTCGKKQGWTFGEQLVGGFILLAVIGAAMNSGTHSTNTPSPNPSQTSNTSSKEEVLSSVKLKYDWGKGGFDNVMEANFTIENQSKYNIKDVEIKCTHYGKSGTAIDSNTRTIYDIVKAKSKKRFDKFNMGFIHTQANSSSCEITDLKVN